MLRLLATALVLALGACTPAEEPPRPKGIVLISLDTLRADRLGAYGYPRPTSRNIDELAAEGVVFTRAVAPSPWTLPSHVSLLTGRYPHRHGVVDEGYALAPYVPLLAERLQAAGFDTFAIVTSQHLEERSGLARGFDRFDYVSEWEVRGRTRRVRNPGWEITGLAKSWLDAREGRPFFLFLHYYDVHSNYSPRGEHRAALVDRYEGPANGSTRQLLMLRRGELELAPRDVRHLSQLYDAEIREVDVHVGTLLRHIERLGLAESTLVVITSDHGEEFLEHGSVLHGRTYYDEVIAIPLVMRGPGLPRGARIDALASLVDVAPTLLSLAGLRRVPGMQGVDLSLHWREGQPLARDYVLAEADWRNQRPGQYRMIRTERYKLVDEWREGRGQLFDLRDDPDERAPLDDPELEARLRQTLTRAVAGARLGAPATPLGAEERELLERLGYVED